MITIQLTPTTISEWTLHNFIHSVILNTTVVIIFTNAYKVTSNNLTLNSHPTQYILQKTLSVFEHRSCPVAEGFPNGYITIGSDRYRS